MTTVNHSIAVLNACNANPDGGTQQAIRAAAFVLGPLNYQSNSSEDWQRLVLKIGWILVMTDSIFISEIARDSSGFGLTKFWCPRKNNSIFQFK